VISPLEENAGFTDVRFVARGPRGGVAVGGPRGGVAVGPRGGVAVRGGIRPVYAYGRGYGRVGGCIVRRPGIVYGTGVVLCR
jgi:hypothetical protein